MSDVGAVAGAVTSVVDAIRPFLEEGLAQRYDKEYNENIIKIQEAFIKNDPDGLWSTSCELLNSSGHPPTPAGLVQDNFTIPRSLVHSLLLVAADCIRERKYVASYSYAVKKN